MNTVTALNILKSWLRANRITYSKPDVSGYDLLVEGPTGCCLVRILDTPAVQLQGVVDILADDIGHDDVDTALSAYHALTERVGAGKPRPFNRGVEPTRNFYGDEEFLTNVRHTEVRRSPDPEPAKFKQYDKVMHKAVWTFYNVNRDFCRRNGLAVEDLMTYAHTMFISFCARLECDDLPQEENEKKLYVWLRQRFAEAFKTMSKRERSTVPDCDTVSIALLDKNYRVEKGRPVEFEYENDPRDVEGDELMMRLMGSKGSTPATDLEYRARRRKLDVSNPGKRKKSAAKMLGDYLDGLSHDDMIAKLAFARQNILIHPDARREANKRLTKHEASCGDCQEKISAHKKGCTSCTPKQICNSFYGIRPHGEHVVSAEVDVEEETTLDETGTEE